MKPESYNSEVKRTNKMEIGSNLVIPVNSDTETISSESIEIGSVAQLRGGQRGIVVPARFWQESDRIHKVPDPSSPRSKSPSKLIGAKKFLNESPVSSPRGLSPLRGGMRPAFTE
ncbi:QWRF motif-containing protein 2-like [Forsythia ovata]|uniref:QWRF motif-containing protein 2-like n=1 Tax=Forsythia ovata TaxID=205694 RepID=A0ABD1RQ50_9LAMI